jgi:hypothetical protein
MLEPSNDRPSASTHARRRDARATDYLTAEQPMTVRAGTRPINRWLEGVATRHVFIATSCVPLLRGR